jgi:hypothetical protein
MTLSLQRKIPCADQFIVRSKTEFLNRLNSPKADLIVMPQEHSLDISSIMRDLPIHERRLTVTREQASTLVVDALQDAGVNHKALSNEMVQKVELFADLFGQEQMELRWEVTEHQSCPKFHCDNVFVRMLVTYFGPTTEFIDQSEPDVIYRAPLGAIVFLKGHKHPTYQDRILHRSPEFAVGEKRFCMIINLNDWLPKHPTPSRAKHSLGCDGQRR